MMDDLGSISADVSALRARLDTLERKVDLVLKHLNLTFDDATQAQVADAVEAALRDGDTIKAITLYRQRTGADLKAAKETVEEMARTLGLS